MTNYCPPPLFPFVQWNFLSVNRLLSDPRCYFFNYGRSALSFLASFLLKRGNYFFIIPAYTCPTVIKSIAAHTHNYTFIDIEENLGFREDDLNEVISTIPSHYKVALLATSLFGVSIRNYKKIYPDFTIIEDRAQTTIDLDSEADYQILSFGKGKLISAWSGGAVVTTDTTIKAAYDALPTEHDFLKSFTNAWLQVIVSRFFWPLINKTPVNPEKTKHHVLKTPPIKKMSLRKKRWLTNSMKAFDSLRRVEIATYYENNINGAFRYALEGKIPLLRYPIKSEHINNNLYNLCGISRMIGYRTTCEQAQAKRSKTLEGSAALAYHSIFLPMHALANNAYIEKVVKIVNSTSQG